MNAQQSLLLIMKMRIKIADDKSLHSKGAYQKFLHNSLGPIRQWEPHSRLTRIITMSRIITMMKESLFGLRDLAMVY